MSATETENLLRSETANNGNGNGNAANQWSGKYDQIKELLVKLAPLFHFLGKIY